MADLTRPDIIETAERRAYVLEQRKGRHSYRNIAALTIKKFGIDNLPRGYDERYAWNDVKSELARLNAQNIESAAEVSRLEQESLDEIQRAVWAQALAGHHGAIDRVLRIMERRARLLGLDAPQSLELGGKDGKDKIEIVVTYAADSVDTSKTP